MSEITTYNCPGWDKMARSQIEALKSHAAAVRKAKREGRAPFVGYIMLNDEVDRLLAEIATLAPARKRRK
jgi:hypothetical protein